LTRSRRRPTRRNLPGTLSTHLVRYVHNSFINGTDVDQIAKVREISVDRVLSVLFSTNIPDDIYAWREIAISRSSVLISNGVPPKEIRAKLNLSFNMFSYIHKRYKSLDVSVKVGQTIQIIKGDHTGQTGVCLQVYTFTQTEVLPFVEIRLCNNMVIKVLAKFCCATK